MKEIITIVVFTILFISYCGCIKSDIKPEAMNDNVIFDEDSLNNRINVLINDLDSPFDILITIDSVSTPKHGIATYDSNYIYYTPNSNFYGYDFFNYSITDGNGGVSTAGVNVTINQIQDIPNANDDVMTTYEDSIENRFDVLYNDVDFDGDDLQIITITMPLHGLATTDGYFIYYTPHLGYVGYDTINYEITDRKNNNDSGEVSIIVTNINPIAVFDTSKGTFKVELFQDKTPKTVENFVKLVNDGFYNGMIFYRISDDFMIQAGRYFPDGSEDQSSYGNIEFEDQPEVTHVDGAISMASTGAGVGGSGEFFICDGEQSFLDGNYAAFGVTIEGIDVVRDIADEPHDNSSSAGGGKPETDIVINSITIE